MNMVPYEQNGDKHINKVHTYLAGLNLDKSMFKTQLYITGFQDLHRKHVTLSNWVIRQFTSLHDLGQDLKKPTRDGQDVPET